MLSDETEEFIDTNFSASDAAFHRLVSWRLSLAILPRAFSHMEGTSADIVSQFRLDVLRLVLTTSVEIAARDLKLFRRSPMLRGGEAVSTLDSVHQNCTLALEIAQGGMNTYAQLKSCIEWASISFTEDELWSRLKLIVAQAEGESSFPEFGMLPLAELPRQGYESWKAIAEAEKDGTWSFWLKWYQAFLDGKPLDWEFQRRLAKLPDEDWRKGPSHIAQKIEDIREEHEAEKAQGRAPATRSVSDDERALVKQKVSANREALALSIASMLEQLSAFREKVRGLNHLEPEFRTELLELIDQLSGKLDALLHDLPMPDETISDEKANRLVLWLREFKPLVRKNAAKYAEPGNVAKAAVPTGIILGCTAIGSLVGPAGAGVGALVGGLITRQVTPGQVANDLMVDRDDPPATTSTC